jgi:hypothetical protein
MQTNAGPNSDRAIGSTRPTPDIDATIAQNSAARPCGADRSRAAIRRPALFLTGGIAGAPIARMSNRAAPSQRISCGYHRGRDITAATSYFPSTRGAVRTYLFSAAAFD